MGGAVLPSWRNIVADRPGVGEGGGGGGAKVKKKIVAFNLG